MYKEPQQKQKVSALRLPRMVLTQKWDHEFKDFLNTLGASRLYFAVMQDEKGELRAIHSGLNEELYALLQVALHRNIEVHDFFKLSLINVEKFRSGEMQEAYALMTRAVEYIRTREAKNLSQ